MRTRANLVAPALAIAALGYSLFTTYTSARHWFPDTRFYGVRTLQYLGRSHTEAKAEAGAFLRAHGVEDSIDDVDSADSRLFRPRVLFPLVSAPFVALVGMRGLLVVPFVSMLVFTFCCWRLFSRRGPPLAAALVVALVVNSSSLAIYSSAALTDGPALALLALALLGLPGEEGADGIPWLVFFATLAAGLTREVGPYVAAAAVIGWLWARVRVAEAGRAWRRVTVAAVGGALLTLAWTTVAGPRNVFYIVDRFAERTGLDRAGAIRHILRETLHRMWGALGRDRVLVIVLVLALIGAVRVWNQREPWMLLSSVAVAFAFLVVNPTFTNLRLQLPIVPFAGILAVRAIASIRWPARSQRPREASGAPV